MNDESAFQNVLSKSLISLQIHRFMTIKLTLNYQKTENELDNENYYELTIVSEFEV